jgi:hypothetical protein
MLKALAMVVVVAVVVAVVLALALAVGAAQYRMVSYARCDSFCTLMSIPNVCFPRSLHRDVLVRRKEAPLPIITAVLRNKLRKHLKIFRSGFFELGFRHN